MSKLIKSFFQVNLKSNLDDFFSRVLLFPVRRYFLYKRMSSLDLYGLRSLSSFFIKTSILNVFFFVDYGTLLGLHRGSSLLKYDSDLDVSVSLLNYEDSDFIFDFLISNKYKIHEIFYHKSSSIIYKIKFEDPTTSVLFDLSIFYPFDNGSFYTLFELNNLWHPRIINISDVTPVDTRHLDNNLIVFPLDSVNILSNHYGPDFNTPDPLWSDMNSLDLDLDTSFILNSTRFILC